MYLQRKIPKGIAPAGKELSTQFSLSSTVFAIPMFSGSPSIPSAPWLKIFHLFYFLDFKFNDGLSRLPNPNPNPNLTVPVPDFPPRLHPNLTTSRFSLSLILTFWLYESSKKIKRCSVQTSYYMYTSVNKYIYSMWIFLKYMGNEILTVSCLHIIYTSRPHFSPHFWGSKNIYRQTFFVN